MITKPQSPEPVKHLIERGNQRLSPVRARSPEEIATIIREGLGELSQREAAKLLGITPAYMNDILQHRRPISAVVASRLDTVGVDGLELFLSQAMCSYFAAPGALPEPDKRAAIGGREIGHYLSDCEKMSCDTNNIAKEIGGRETGQNSGQKPCDGSLS